MRARRKISRQGSLSHPEMMEDVVFTSLRPDIKDPNVILCEDGQHEMSESVQSGAPGKTVQHCIWCAPPL